MRLSITKRLLLSALSGIILTIAFPYTGSLFPLAFITFIPLLLVEHDIYLNGEKARKVLLYAFITFFLYNTGSNYWLYYSKTAGVIPFAAHLINALIMTSFFMFYHWAKRNVGQKYERFSILFFVIVWVAFEYIHYNWELATPWMTIGNIFAIVPEIVQWYSITGVLGGSLWILVVNAFLYLGIRNVVFKKNSMKSQSIIFTIGAGIVVLPAVLSYWTYSTYEETIRPKEVIVTQPNTEQYVERKTTNLKDQLDKLFDVATPLITENTEIIIGPETVIPNHYPIHERAFHLDTGYLYTQLNVDKWNGPDLYMGVASYQTFNNSTRHTIKKYKNGDGYYEVYDASILVKKGERPQFVHKAKLVLAAEKIPFSKSMPFLENFARDIRGTVGTLGSGTNPEVLRAKGFNFAPVNCYESIYGEWVSQSVKKGAEVIFAITNDGWWGESAGYKQHNSFSRLRAIENRRYVARSSMTGISCVINQRGDIIQSLGYGVHNAFKETIQLNKKQTFYTQHGDYIGRFFEFFFYIILIFNVFSLGKRWIQKWIMKKSKK